MELDRKLKTALDESRLLILGAQVLFGFQFQAVFQEGFKDLAKSAQWVQCAGLVLLLLAVCSLIAPSLHHQLIHRGESRRAMLSSATAFAGASLLPLSLALGLSTFVVFQHLFGVTAGLVGGSMLAAVGLGLLYGLGFWLKRNGGRSMPREQRDTPITTKIEQMLTEARVIIPGGQALLGFQFIATLTKAFQELPSMLQYVHAAALCAVALAVLLLMTPAAVHRIAFQGEDDPSFFRIGSRLVVAAALPLAIGIAGDVAVVFYKVAESGAISAFAGGATLATLIIAWYVYPAMRAHISGFGMLPSTRTRDG